MKGSVVEAKKALRDTYVVGLGYVPLGFAFGVFAVTQGFPVWLSIVSSIVIYAGSMEFTAVGLILTGVSLPQIAVTTFFVNFRHLFYGLSFPLHRVRSLAGRLYGVHALTDEAYALLASRPAGTLSGVQVVTTKALCQAYWVMGVAAGALVGNLLSFDTNFLGFALTALFVTLAVDAYKQNRQWGIGIAAFGCALAGVLFAREQMLVVALGLFTVLILANAWFRLRRAK